MRGGLLALLLVIPLLSGLAAAHDPDTFTVIVREDSHDPLEVDLVVNDTVQYYNVDYRENITHEIGLDLNGDGDFNDTDEFSSGTLHSECDWDNDSDCRVAWIFVINDTNGSVPLRGYGHSGKWVRTTMFMCLTYQTTTKKVFRVYILCLVVFIHISTLVTTMAMI